MKVSYCKLPVFVFAEGSLCTATSAIDYETDTVIQSSLRHGLGSDVTLFTIAHRLQTIVRMSFDGSLLVLTFDLSDGCRQDYGS